MTDAPGSPDRNAITAIVSDMEAAWNSGDGQKFGAPFAADADFVTIRAEHFRGREAISSGHAAIFRTIYAGSVNQFTIESLRFLRPDVALVHVDAVLKAPAGPSVDRTGDNSVNAGDDPCQACGQAGCRWGHRWGRRVMGY